jgi:hypothetical protein
VSPGNVEFVQVVVLMTVVPGFVAAVVRLDERRLRGVRLERAWTPVTRDAVIFASWQFGILFGCPALLVWFIRTRWSPWGVALGVAGAAALLAVSTGALVLCEATIDWLGL